MNSFGILWKKWKFVLFRTGSTIVAENRAFAGTIFTIFWILFVCARHIGVSFVDLGSVSVAIQIVTDIFSIIDEACILFEFFENYFLVQDKDVKTKCIKIWTKRHPSFSFQREGCGKDVQSNIFVFKKNLVFLKRNPFMEPPPLALDNGAVSLVKKPPCGVSQKTANGFHCCVSQKTAIETNCCVSQKTANGRGI